MYHHSRQVPSGSSRVCRQGKILLGPLRAFVDPSGMMDSMRMVGKVFKSGDIPFSRATRHTYRQRIEQKEEDNINVIDIYHVLQ